MTDNAKGFVREGRYIVIKRSHLQPSQWNGLRSLLDTHRINPVDAVVVEADWPEYEPVWQMIEDRVSGRHREQEAARTADVGLRAESIKNAVLDLPFANTAAIEWDDADWHSVRRALTALSTPPADDGER